MYLSIVERAGSRSIASVNEVSGDKGTWERITVVVSSGTVDSVGPRTMAQGIKIRDSLASRAGLKYRAVNGATIYNQGEQDNSGSHYAR